MNSLRRVFLKEVLPSQRHHYFRRALSVTPPIQEKREESYSDKTQYENKRNAKSLRALGVAGGLTLASYLILKNKNASNFLAASSIPSANEKNPGLPVYKASEIAEHYNSDKKIWVSYLRGVYDVTEFISKHPGGDKILMAAGGSLEPFWELYPVHNRTEVLSILEKHRIGNLAEEDLVKEEQNDSFKGEPRRHSSFRIRSAKPYNGETPPFILTEKFYTPNELFYVRNHLPVPEINVEGYTVEVEGLGVKGKTFSLKDIKKLPKVEISAVIQCGGNRRSEMGKSRPVAGLAWTGGAIGNARWGGARLRDVLKASGFNPSNYKNPEKIHVQFEGLDSDPSGESYGSSIPLSFILDDNFEPIVAYEMNRKQIPLDHGFPLRIILPGIVGARSVKWLYRIIISEEESQSPWQQRDYKVFSPSVTMDTVDFSTAPPIMDTPVTSYICVPEPDSSVKQGISTFKGYAYSGGGRDIVRVEVSCDKGKTWKIANITAKEKNGTRNWAWIHWETSIELKGGDVEVWVKAVDSGYNQQAEDSQNIWNYRGLLSNSYHKIMLKVTK